MDAGKLEQIKELADAIDKVFGSGASTYTERILEMSAWEGVADLYDLKYMDYSNSTQQFMAYFGTEPSEYGEAVCLSKIAEKVDETLYEACLNEQRFKNGETIDEQETKELYYELNAISDFLRDYNNRKDETLAIIHQLDDEREMMIRGHYYFKTFRAGEKFVNGLQESCEKMLEQEFGKDSNGHTNATMSLHTAEELEDRDL